MNIISKLRTVLPVILCAFFVTACAGGAKHQGRAGITDAVATFHENGKPKKIKFIDGKEKEIVEITMDLKDGTFTYSAGGVTAFEGQRIRGEVEKAVAEQWPALADSASDILTNIITKAIGAP